MASCAITLTRAGLLAATDRRLIRFSVKDGLTEYAYPAIDSVSTTGGDVFRALQFAFGKAAR